MNPIFRDLSDRASQARLAVDERRMSPRAAAEDYLRHARAEIATRRPMLARDSIQCRELREVLEQHLISIDPSIEEDVIDFDPMDLDSAISRMQTPADPADRADMLAHTLVPSSPFADRVKRTQSA